MRVITPQRRHLTALVVLVTITLTVMLAVSVAGTTASDSSTPSPRSRASEGDGLSWLPGALYGIGPAPGGGAVYHPPQVYPPGSRFVPTYRQPGTPAYDAAQQRQTFSSPTPTPTETYADPRGGVTDAGVNPWGANDCTVLVEALGQEAPPTCIP
jgi:hypothetical protein